MENLISDINSFDTYYEMTDSDSVFDSAKEKEAKIKKELSALPEDQLQELISKLNSTGEFNFSRYFQK